MLSAHDSALFSLKQTRGKAENKHASTNVREGTDGLEGGSGGHIGTACGQLRGRMNGSGSHRVSAVNGTQPWTDGAAQLSSSGRERICGAWERAQNVWGGGTGAKGGAKGGVKGCGSTEWRWVGTQIGTVNGWVGTSRLRGVCVVDRLNTVILSFVFVFSSVRCGQEVTLRGHLGVHWAATRARGWCWSYLGKEAMCLLSRNTTMILEVARIECLKWISLCCLPGPNKVEQSGSQDLSLHLLWKQCRIMGR